jgi:4'-phosphopantetheinyl transferase EntD
MIGELFGPAVETDACYHDVPVELPAIEAACVARAVPARRAEFATGRACARRCLERLGAGQGPIEQDDRGAPTWPPGVVGTITHCRGFRGAAVASTTTHVTLGVDCEPNEPLPPGTADDIARPDERGWLRSRPFEGVNADRLLFSAKESVYKSWYPLARRWLDFHDVRIEFGDHDFTAHVLIDLAHHEQVLRTITGRWVVAHDLIATATEIRQEPDGPH